MFAVAGVSGKTGGAVAQVLLAQGKRVRALVRDASRASVVANSGAEVALSALDNAETLTRALAGSAGLYVLLPENPQALDVHGQRCRIADALSRAVRASEVPHVVLLSAAVAGVVADNSAPSLAADLRYAERALAASGCRLSVLRACYFQENVLAALAPARSEGIYPNLLPGSDFTFPTVATRDVARFAAHCLLELPERDELIDVIGPQYSVRDLAARLGAAIGRSLHVVDIPAAQQVAMLRGAGMSEAYARALAGLFAQFAPGRERTQAARTLTGTTTLEDTLSTFIQPGGSR